MTGLRALTSFHDWDVWVRQERPPPRPPWKPTKYEIAGVGGVAVALAGTEAPAGRAGPLLQSQKMADTAMRRLDYIYRTNGGLDQAYYSVVAAFVGYFRNHISRSYGWRWRSSSWRSS